MTKTTHKTVTLKAHHAKPYRKRHIGLLVVSLVALVIVAGLLIQYRDKVISGLASSVSFVSDLFGGNTPVSYTTNVQSTYGFGLTYDRRTFSGSAIDGSNGNLYVGAELSTARSYQVVRITPDDTIQPSLPSGLAFTLTYHTNAAAATTPLEAVALQDGGLEAARLTKTGESAVTIGGSSFTQTTWKSTNSVGLGATIQASFVTYTGVVNGHAVTIVLQLGLNTDNQDVFTPIINSLTFGGVLGATTEQTSEVVAAVQQSRTILDGFLGTQFAAAEGDQTTTTSEKVAAEYSPAVVKIYHAYCVNINIDGKTYLTNACDALSGSGFIVSQDGYIGTTVTLLSRAPKTL